MTSSSTSQASCPGWAETAYEVLTDPAQAFERIAGFGREKATGAQNLALNTVFLASTIVGLAQFELHYVFGSILLLISTITCCMFTWVLLTILLIIASRLFSGAGPQEEQAAAAARKLTWRTALSAVGWTFLPFVFWAPLYCFKPAMGPFFFIPALIPLGWSIALLFFAARSLLTVSSTRLVAACLILPPAAALIYFFWLFSIIYVFLLAMFLSS